MFWIPDDTGGEGRTVSFREWVTAGRAQRARWRAERIAARVAARTSSSARAADRAAQAKSHRDQANGLSGGGAS
jgi:hypothetical protein